MKNWKDQLFLLAAALGFFVFIAIPPLCAEFGWISRERGEEMIKWQILVYIFCVAPIFVKRSSPR